MSALNSKSNESIAQSTTVKQELHNSPSSEIPNYALDLNPNGTVRIFPPPIPSNILPHNQELYSVFFV